MSSEFPERDPARVDVEPDLDAEPHPAAVLGVIAVGGVLGAEARYGLGLLVKHSPTVFPTSTLIINIVGSLLLGVLMAVIAARRVPALAGPFIGVGVLGGFTTFSTFAVDVVGLTHRHHAGTAAAYLVATVLVCAVAVWVGDRVTRVALDR